MSPADPPRRLGRGLDALLARRVPASGAGEAGAHAQGGGGGRDPATPATPGTGAGPALISGPGGGDRASDPMGGASDTGSPYADGVEGERISALRSLPLAQIRPNPYQPRREFGKEELAELEASLRVNGLLQPVTVRPAPNGDGFELIAGERRLRAAGRLGWSEIMAVVRPTDDRDALTLAMIENLQRADLDPIEEADGYQRLIEEFRLSQSEVAEVVGKERSTVANALRLRALPQSVRAMVQERRLTAGHARALLALGNERAILALAQEAADQSLSVREVERRVQTGRAEPARSGRKLQGHGQQQGQGGGARAAAGGTAEGRRIEELLRRRLQTGVGIHLTDAAKGELRIEFYSNDDLERLLALMGISLEQ